MITTKIFKSGNSLAVRLPKELCFNESEEVEMFKRGDEIVIRHKSINLSAVFDLLTDMPEDYMSGKREDPQPEERDF